MAQVPVIESRPTNDTGITVCKSDPYKHLDHLGHGSYGYVDKVQDISVEQSPAPTEQAVYARKVIRIRAGGNREDQLRSARNEFTILKRLKHRHVVSVYDIYQYKNRLNIVMGEVADTDLAEYLLNVDGLTSEDPRKDALKATMHAWPGCLIQVIDYLHEMQVKHKDIKPANILIMIGQVLIADFGISKDLIDQETTASLNSNGDVGTRMYCAPEVLSGNHRRGRAADIYSLGCVFLEISTVLLGPRRSLDKFSRHRELSGSRLYSTSGLQILQWFRYLWAIMPLNYMPMPSRESLSPRKIYPHGRELRLLI
jgi:serine/threonine protein kinase